MASALSEQKTGSPPSWRGAACVTSMLAHNMPDIDLFVTGVTGGRIGYLVHHRGHTHTLALVIPLALLAMAPAWAWMRAKKRELEWRPLFALAVIGGVMHLAMDGTNEYGVHPWWPLDNRWYYGDSVFIIEPLLWMSAIPTLIFGLRSRLSRALIALLMLLMIGLTWALPAYVRVVTAATVTGYGLLMLAIAHRAPRTIRPLIGAASWLLVTAMFVMGSLRAEATVRAAMRERFPGDRIDDVALAPLPADPLCWNVIVVSRSVDRYRALTARVALAPSWLAAERCPHTVAERTAPVAPLITTDVDPAVSWGVGLDLPHGELATLSTRCDVAAFLRFARVPFWLTTPAGRLQMGDLRYDRDDTLGFAEVELPSVVGRCPPRVPPWVPPRQALLDL